MSSGSEAVNGPGAKSIERVSEEASATAVIAVRNGEKTIGFTLRSLLLQRGGALRKIVVVDDDCSDATLERINEATAAFRKADDPPVQIISNRARQWHYRSRNIGAEAVDTPYMFFLDADDLVDPNYAAKMVSTLQEHPYAPFAYCDVDHFTAEDDAGTRDREKIIIHQRFRLPEFDRTAFMHHNFISYSSMIRTSHFRQIGGNSEFLNDCWNHAVERHLWLRLVHRFGSPVHVPETLFLYRLHQGQLSTKHKRGRSDQQTQMFFNLGFAKVGLTTPGRKILLVCSARDPRNPLLPGRDLYIWIQPLQKFGEVFCFFPDVEERYFGRRAMLERLLTYAASIRSELVFCANDPETMDDATWSELSRRCRTIVWVERMNGVLKDSRPCLHSFSLVLTPDPLVEQSLRSMGVRVCPTPWAANAHYLKPVPEAQRRVQIAFPGERTPYRAQMVQALPVLTCGPLWPNGMLEYPALCNMMAGSGIVLNLSRDREPLLAPNLRIFEATSCGALCLTEPAAGLDQCFKMSPPDAETLDPSDEVVVFNGRGGLESRLEILFRNPALMRRIAANGLCRARRDHGWTNRFGPLNDLLKADHASPYAIPAAVPKPSRATAAAGGQGQSARSLR